MKIKLLKITRLLFGDYRTLKLEHRIANIVWFFSALMGFLTTVMNSVLGLSFTIILATALFFILQLCFYTIARLKSDYFDLLIQLTILTFIVSIAHGWITDGGSTGSWGALIFASLILSVMLTRGNVKIYIIIVHIALLIILMFVEYHYPDMILLYSSMRQRFFDVTATYVFMIFFLGLAMFFYTRSYAAVNKRLYKSNLEIQEKNYRIEEELSVARKIQENLIPTKAPLENIAILYRSMTQVGGDFFDFFHFREEPQVGIFISDVSGHGVPAALITSMLKSLILENAKKKQDPALLLSHLNDMLLQQVGDKFITAFYGIYNPIEKSLLCSNAGHVPPLIISKDGVTELSLKKSVALAVMDNKTLHRAGLVYENTKIIFNDEKKIVLYTDGLTEAPFRSDRYIPFGETSLYEALYEYRNLSCHRLIETVYNDLIAFTGKESFDDDICIIVVDI